MKKITITQRREIMNKIISGTTRWNTSLDNALFDSYILNADTPMLTDGLIYTPSKLVTLNDVQNMLTVVYNPYMLLGNGLKVAMVMYVPIILGPTEIKVFVDDHYANLTPDAQAALLWHELGHIANRNINFGGYRDIQNEYDADLYAVQMVGKDTVIKALTEMLNNCKGIMQYYNRKELRKRINNIKAIKGGRKAC